MSLSALRPDAPLDVLCIGNATLDAIAAPLDALPEWDRMALVSDYSFSPGGCALSTALGLVRLGRSSGIICRLGEDDFGDRLHAALAAGGVDVTGVVRDEDTTTSFTYVLRDVEGRRCYLHTPGANARLSLADIPQARLAEVRIVNLSGVLGLDSLDGDIAELLKCARSTGALTCLDMIYNTAADAPAIARSALEHVDCFAPSLEEAQLVAGTEALSAADMTRMFCDWGCGAAIVKQGTDGCFLCSGGGDVLHIPACTPEKVLDATGAGDSWISGFLTGLLRDEDAVCSAQLGNAAASFCIEAPGTTAGIPELDQVLARREDAPEPRPA